MSHSKVMPLKSKLETREKLPGLGLRQLHFKLKLTFRLPFQPIASLQQRHDFPHVEQDVSALPQKKKGIKAAGSQV